jgi:carboxyl-terminal processing protease
MKIHLLPKFAKAVATTVLLATTVTGFAQTPKPRLPVDSLRAFAEVLGAATSSYVKEVDPNKLIGYAIRGMLQGLDANSDYLDKEAFSDLQAVSPDDAGVGIELGVRAAVEIVSPIDGAPASRAGVRSGDIVEKINDVNLNGKGLPEAVKLLRGRPGTEVVLTIRSQSDSKSREIGLVREIVRVPSVVSKLAETNIGYVRVTRLQVATLDNFAKQTSGLYEENKRPLRGLILDLRSNPGGILRAAVGLASAFLPENATVLSTDGRVDDAKRTFRARSDDYLRSGQQDFRRLLPPQFASVPVAVLIDRGTAAGSEVVAAALKAHKRAVLIGERSFGKGSVQTILPLGNNGAIKLTTAFMFTPGGQAIDANGVTPDEILSQEISRDQYASESDQVYQRALEILRKRIGA